MSVRITKLLILIALLIATSTAHARIVGLYVGGGPRLLDEEWTPMTSVHAYVGIDTMLDLTGDIHVRPLGFDQEAVEFAGGSVGLAFIPPIPGPIGAEAGLSAGVVRPGAMTDFLTEPSEDEYLPVFSYEFAATVALLPMLRLRASYQSALGSPAGTAKQLFGSQFLVMVGLGL
jgi:hypothetical protein